MGEDITIEESARVLHEVCNCVRYGDTIKRFPGMQPTSLRRSDLRKIQDANYVVCEKTDGERCFLYIRDDVAYFVDRKAAVQKATIPKLAIKGNLENAESQVTLLDGERVGDMFLIFDAVLVQGRDVLYLPLDQRLVYALDIIKLNEDHPLNLSMKDFFRLKHLRFLWTEVCPRLPHDCDGLIFTPISDPYSPGTSKTLFKWKPSEMNTVDFKLQPTRIEDEVHVQLLVLNEHALELYGWLAHGEKPLAGIVECKWDPSAETFIFNEDKWVEGGWVIFRERDDKDVPNCILTASRVEETIMESLQFDDLLKELGGK